MTIKLPDTDLGGGISVEKLSMMPEAEITATLEGVGIDVLQALRQEMGTLCRSMNMLDGQFLIGESRRQVEMDVALLGSVEIRNSLRHVQQQVANLA